MVNLMFFKIKGKEIKKGWNMKNVLIIGSGGREHALAWKILESSRIGNLYVAPGNGGTKLLAENLSIDSTDINGLIKFVKDNNVGLTIVGPDDLLAAGVVDSFQREGLRIFGPTLAAAQIEASKAFAKNFMTKARIPTAPFRVFGNYEKALEYVRNHGAPIVIKASGLALGKGAYPCRTLDEAEESLWQVMCGRIHGKAGNEVVIEEFLEGQEVSIHAFCDGRVSSLMPTSQDHKPVFDDDRGPNTGGMGTFAPVPWVDSELIERIKKTVVDPVLDGFAKKGHPFSGCLYPGLKITEQGPMVLEFNARFGDPEIQSYVRLLETDLLDIMEACIDKRLSEIDIKWKKGFAICVVIASGGYPGDYKKWIPISGLTAAEKLEDVVIFHAGTTRRDYRVITSGGRVLSVTATGETLQIARDRVYKAVKSIHFEDMHFRRDIGAKALRL